METPSLERREVEPSLLLQCMTTEHFTLQTARSMTVSDSTGRASLFLGTVSSTLIALAFVGQSSQLGTPFYLFALVLFPRSSFWASSRSSGPFSQRSKIFSTPVALTAFVTTTSRWPHSSPITFCFPCMTMMLEPIVVWICARPRGKSFLRPRA